MEFHPRRNEAVASVRRPAPLTSHDAAAERLASLRQFATVGAESLVPALFIIIVGWNAILMQRNLYHHLSIRELFACTNNISPVISESES